MARAGILAAEYTRGSKLRPATLDITTIAGGRRSRWCTFAVKSKAEARTIAETYGATPWNF